MKIKHLLILSLTLVVLTACQSKPGSPPDTVTVQLKWVHQAQFAGFYVAQDKGYYAEENLDVTLLEGGPDVDIIGTVVDGEADFGIFSSENLIVERSQGEPVVAVATIFRRSPLVFVSLAESGIERPEDFLGHSAALAQEAVVQMQAMLERLGLDTNQVVLKPYEYDHTSFIEGQVDITYAYSTGGLIRLHEKEKELNLIWPSDYGVHLYADTLFTTDTILTENPDLVTRFLRATLRGWQEAVENTDQAVDATLNYAKEANPALQTEMMEASLPLIHTGEDHIGWMRPDIWQGTHDILLQQGIIDAPLEVNEVYTLEFLEEIYGED